MSASRKGLQRHGMRSYVVSSPGIVFIIRRDRARRWLVRNAKFEDLAWDFFAVSFRSLKDARAWAERQVWPFPVRKSVRRRHPRKSDPSAILLAAKLIVEERKNDGAE